MGFIFLASYVVYGIMIVFYVLFFILGVINVTVITLHVRMVSRQKEKSLCVQPVLLLNLIFFPVFQAVNRKTLS